ncbi:Glycosyl transferases group 1 [compost metagenome]
MRAIGKSIFASVFCDDYDSDGVRWSYADVYLPGCLPYLEGIFCDTQAYPRELARRFGADVSKLHTLYFPHALSARPRYRAGSGRSILWAARFSRQKRVDLLERIASLMPDVRFDVHGCGSSPGEQELAKRLARLGNVTVNGPFESLDQLVEDGKYSAFLYTSAWDGLPIVLLDATAAGLPIVASSVGGVGEFITEKTGVPVSCPDNAEDYVSGIRSVIDGPECGRALWENAVKLLNDRHAMEHFRSVITKVPGYL